MSEARNLTISLLTAESRRHFNEVVMGMILAGKTPRVEFVDDEEEVRSGQQNKALNLWCEMCATTFNDAGIDLRHAIREEVEIPVTKSSFKEYIWRPLQKVMTGHTSTTKPSRSEYPRISETIQRHFAQTKGLVLPAWPVKRRAGEQ